jgi:hypothetical protein
MDWTGTTADLDERHHHVVQTQNHLSIKLTITNHHFLFKGSGDQERFYMGTGE